MAADDVQLPDLEVIQRYSLAIRTASAPRADVIAALQADLDWLTAGGGRPAAEPPSRSTARSTGRTPAKTPAKAPARGSARTPARTPGPDATTPAPPKRASRRTPAKRTEA